MRTINAARRKLSEREEEERNRKTGTVSSATAGVPKPERKASADEHGSHAIFTPGTNMTASPIAATAGNFGQPGSSVASGSSKAIGIPGQPQVGEYNLTSQMAKMSFPTSVSPSTSTMPRLPSQRIVSGASTRRDPSASSYSSSAAPQDYFGPASLNNTLSNSGSTWAQQVQPSSDEDSFSDHPPQTAPVGSMSTQPSLSLAIQPPAPVDPKKIILQAYLMKRSKGRGRKVWRKRWFFLTSQGLTYTKSHMVGATLDVPLFRADHPA